MKFTLQEKRPETEDVTTFIFTPESPIEWKAGQYLHYVLDHPNADDRGIERYFTNSAAPFELNPQITTRNYGAKASSFKKALFAMEVGAQIEADGVEGSFTLEDFSKKYIFIAGGIGITPFRAIFAQLNHDNQKVNLDLLYANRNDTYVFEKDITDFAANQPNFKLYKYTDPKTIEEDEVRKLVLDLNAATYYISGPKPMVEHYKEMLWDMGILEENIKLDDFPGYDKI